MKEVSINIKKILSTPQKIVILGAGESGIGAALLARKMGHTVFVSDGGLINEDFKNELIENQIAFEENNHHLEAILTATIIIKSPGIPDKSTVIQAIKNNAIPIISEIELAYHYKGTSTIVAITGSNGKSTCTTLLHHICETAGLPAALVGNIGYSIARQIAENPQPLYITEISSFQLDDSFDFKPDIAILLNITADHLDRYNYQFENYVLAKTKIFANQSAENYLIYCKDDMTINQTIHDLKPNASLLPFSIKEKLTEGAFLEGDQMMIKTSTEQLEMSVCDFTLKGQHNIYNTMAAGIAAATLGIRKAKIRAAIQSFKSLEHRMETVATVEGVEFINDSKATNINSTWYAVESMIKPTILIMGGIDKGNDYSLMEDLVREKVKAIICLGIDNSPILKGFKGIVPMIETQSMQDAVSESFKLATEGDVVLLSPGCSSFDLFKNFGDRGRQFKKMVKSL